MTRKDPLSDTTSLILTANGAMKEWRWGNRPALPLRQNFLPSIEYRSSKRYIQKHTRGRKSRTIAKDRTKSDTAHELLHEKETIHETWKI